MADEDVQALAKAALPTIGMHPNEVLNGEVVIAVSPSGGYAYVEWKARRMLTQDEAVRIVRAAEELGQVTVTSLPDGHVYR